jgi:hypothetical protein
MSLMGGKCQFWVENRWWKWLGKLGGTTRLTLDQFPMVLMPFGLNQSLIRFVNRWKCHLRVENVNFGWKPGAGNEGGS